MQATLFGQQEPALDPLFRRASRIHLDVMSWVDRVPGWVQGHQRLFEQLREQVHWRTQRRPMYDRIVEVPRLLGTVSSGTVSSATVSPATVSSGIAATDRTPPILRAMSRALTERYGEPLDAITLALYRDGQDSVAWHADQVLRDMPSAVVAVVSLGGERKFMVRPARGGESRSWSIGWGDLMVMGGACQRRWHHAVPKQRHAEPRMAVMFRNRTLRPDTPR
ncbi:MAG: alpha-ketoglutarate-dependent dioxygenase AlkB [Myxococcota bacterium]